MAARKNQTDRVIRDANDLEGGRIVSLEEAVDALQSFERPAKTIAHRASAECDDTALLILGQINTGENLTCVRTLVGKNEEIASMIAYAMKTDPNFKAIIVAAVMAESVMSISG